jgi:hypothetical protein
LIEIGNRISAGASVERILPAPNEDSKAAHTSPRNNLRAQTELSHDGKLT